MSNQPPAVACCVTPPLTSEPLTETAAVEMATKLRRWPIRCGCGCQRNYQSCRRRGLRLQRLRRRRRVTAHRVAPPQGAPRRRVVDLAAPGSADPDWLASLITRRVSLHRAQDAFTAGPDDVKVIITLDDDH
jgi:hypothetical protein